MPELEKIAGRSIVIFRGVGGRELLRETLEARGARVEYAECYRRMRVPADVAPAHRSLEARRDRRVRRHQQRGPAQLLRDAPSRGAPHFAATPLFVPHPRIAATARELGLKRVFVTGAGDDGLAADVEGISARLCCGASSAPHTVRARYERHDSAAAGGSGDADLSGAGSRCLRTGRAGALAVVLALVALVLLGFEWYTSRGSVDTLRQEVAKKLAEADTLNKESQARRRAVARGERRAQVKIGVLESRLAESQGQQIALEALYQDLSRNRDEWAFADIEQSLLIASQQLQLAGNVKSALIALQNADMRLQRMERPQLTPLGKPSHATSSGWARCLRRYGRHQRAPGQRDLGGGHAAPRDGSASASEGAATETPGEQPAGPWKRFWREAWTK